MGKGAVVFVLMLVPGLASAQLESLSPLDTAVCRDHGVTFFRGSGRVDAYFCRQILTDLTREKQALLLSDSVKAHYLEIAGVDLGRRSEPLVAPEDSQSSTILESLVAMGFATVRDGRAYVMQETWVSFDAEKKERLTRETFPDFFGQVYDYRSGRRLASFDPFLGFRIH